MGLIATLNRQAVCAVVCCIAAISCSGCAQIRVWLDDRAAQSEARQATQHENPAPQPTSAMYIVELSDGSARQTNMSFNGQGTARIFDATESGGPKTIIDYNTGTITREVSRDPWKTETFSLDPSFAPPVYDAKGATTGGARATGSGYLKGHEYHKFTKSLPSGDWEIWTDDDGAFPVFYSYSKDGKSTTWRLKNAWTDQGLLDREVFFDPAKPDPQPAPLPPSDTDGSG